MTAANAAEPAGAVTVAPVGTATKPLAQRSVHSGLARSRVSVAVPSHLVEVAVAWVSADGRAGGQSATVTGGGLTWRLAGRANASAGDAEAWYATTVGVPFTVTAVAAQPGLGIQLAVSTYTGASGIGAVTSVSGESGAPSAGLTPQANGSIVAAVGMDWDWAILRTPAPGNTIDRQDTDSDQDTYWEQHLDARSQSGTAVTIADTAPTADEWNLVAIEVLSANPPPTCKTAADTVEGKKAAVFLTLNVSWCYTPAGVVSSNATYSYTPARNASYYYAQLNKNVYATGEVGFGSSVSYSYFNLDLGTTDGEILVLNALIDTRGQLSFNQNTGG
ncbi:hypothetical protein [Jatrophihabitans sp. GAS493]|uniref:hypothetical protein n=1 Tax=Jatrophihabitans sp. GAS493 TaxID=1907575 RepID=UPI000BB69865|nr:hypothetical protein [Jatrophihabitans sp. GAS493]